MAERRGRPPDFWVKAMDKDTDVRGKVGAAWNNPDGSIYISLDPWVVLDGGPHMSIVLFPNDRKRDQ